MNGFWADGFWAQGFWSAGFWSEDLAREDEVFDAPHQKYIDRINAERARSFHEIRREQDAVAFLETRAYDSHVGAGAPRVGASPSILEVAPVLASTAQGIIVRLDDKPPSPVAVQNNVQSERADPAALLAMFMLLLDD